MARFRYRMQSVLNIKLKMETQAKQEFAAAKMALDEEEEKLNALFARKDAYEKEAAVLLKDHLKVREIIDNKTAILRMDEYIKAQQLQVRLAAEQVEKARVRLQEVMTERKTHETSKEKAFEDFLKEENRAESKEIDQLTSYTYGQRQMQEAKAVTKNTETGPEV